ncbi:MAG: hypothetical protein M3123_03560, partial [Actinomycetota bacterium]|nr:hypothetical protein [Actinomycetota bacterium]
MTVFHPREAFRPTTVESFVADANLEAATGPGTWVLVDPAPTPAKLPKTAVPVRRLNQRACFAGSGPAALQCYVNASADNTRSIVYGRVVKERDATVIQYWYFYYHNLYTYPFRTPGLPPGALWQAHEGDWELVNVVLGRTGEPSYVAYSQHCTGERRPWSKTRRRGGSHPVVYVALGSHAHPKRRRPLDSAVVLPVANPRPLSAGRPAPASGRDRQRRRSGPARDRFRSDVDPADLFDLARLDRLPWLLG